MGYVQAGYSIVLGILFLYGVGLVRRRRKLNRAVDRVVAADVGAGPGRGPVTSPSPGER
jgi:hypothetical protein